MANIFLHPLGGSGSTGVNTEILVAPRELLSSDKKFQHFSCASPQDVTLLDVSGVEGDCFVIINIDPFNTVDSILNIYIGIDLIDCIYPGGVKKYIHNGITWTTSSVATGDLERFNNISIGAHANGSESGIAIGYNADGHDLGVAIGREANGGAGASGSGGVAIGKLADGSSRGTAIGEEANGSAYGVALGTLADGSNFGVAIGWSTGANNDGVAVGQEAIAFDGGTSIGRSSVGSTYGAAVGVIADANGAGTAVGVGAIGDTQGAAVGLFSVGRNASAALGCYANTHGKLRAVALGPHSDTDRVGDICHSVDGGVEEVTGDDFIGIAAWSNVGVVAAWTEIFLGGEVDERFTVAADSVLAFKITVVAKVIGSVDNCAMYEIKGFVRNNNGTMTMLNNVCTTIYETDAGWDVRASIDDTNDALIVEVLGHATLEMNWNARIDYTEIRSY